MLTRKGKRCWLVAVTLIAALCLILLGMLLWGERHLEKQGLYLSDIGWSYSSGKFTVGQLTLQKQQCVLLQASDLEFSKPLDAWQLDIQNLAFNSTCLSHFSSSNTADSEASSALDDIPPLTVSVDIEQLLLDNLYQGSVSFAFEQGDFTLALQAAAPTPMTGKATLNIQGSLVDEQISGELQVDSLSTTADAPLIDASVTLSGELKELLTAQPKFSLNGHLKVQREAMGLELPVSLQGDPQQQKLIWKGGRLSIDDQVVAIEGSVSLEQQSYQLTNSSRLSVENSGTFRSHLTSSGSLTATQFNGEHELTLSQGENRLQAFGPWQLDTGSLTLAHQPQIELVSGENQMNGVLLADIEASPEKARVSVQGGVVHPELQTPASIAFEGIADLKQLTSEGIVTLNATLKERLGQLELIGNWRGTPQQVSLDLVQEKNKVTFAMAEHEVEIRPDLKLNYSVEGSNVKLTGLTQLMTPWGEATAEPDISLDVGSDHLSGLIPLSYKGALVEGGLTSTLKGAGELKLEGATTDPQLTLTYNDISGSVEQQPLAGLQALEIKLGAPILLWPMRESLTVDLNGRTGPILLDGQELSSWDWQLAAQPFMTEPLVNWSLTQQESQVAGRYAFNSRQLELEIGSLQLDPFAPLVASELQLLDGKLTATASVDLQDMTNPYIEADVAWHDLAGEIEERLFSGLSGSSTIHGPLNNLGCSGDVQLDWVNSGVVIDAISSQFSGRYSPQGVQARLINLKGDILGGVIQARRLNFPNAEFDQVVLKGIDLAKVVAQQEEPAVAATGKVDIRVPLSLTAEGAAIKGGSLMNRTPVTMKITDTVVLDAYIQANPTMAFALEMLRALDISLLKATFDMERDGLLKAQASIQGQSPGEPRPVHLNYGHEENMYELMESLRLSDSFQEQLEQKLNHN